MLIRTILLFQVLSALTLFALGGYTLRRERRRDIAQPFFFLSVSLGLWIFFNGISDLLSYALGRPIPFLSSLAGMGIILAGSSTLYFGWRFPRTELNARSAPWAKWILRTLLVATIPVLAMPWSDLWISNRRFEGSFYVGDYGPLYYVTSWFIIINALVGTFFLAWKYRSFDNPTEKTQIQFALAGITGSVAIIFVFSYFLAVNGYSEYFNIGPFAGTIFFLLFMRGIGSNKRLDIRAVMNRTINRLVSFTLFLVVFYAAISYYVFRAVKFDQGRLLVVLAVLLLLLFPYLITLQPRIDNMVSKLEYHDENTLYNFIEDIRDFPEQSLLQDSITNILNALVRNLKIEKAAICILEPDYGVRTFCVPNPKDLEQTLSPGSALLRPRVWATLFDPRRIQWGFMQQYPIRLYAPAFANNERSVRQPRIYASLVEAFQTLKHKNYELCLPVVQARHGIALILLGHKENRRPFFENEMQLIRSMIGGVSVNLTQSIRFHRIYKKELMLQAENEALADLYSSQTKQSIRLDDNRELIYASESMHKVVELIELAAKTDSSVLIQGESGTGKELVARLLHQKSKRKGNFVAVNIAAIPEALLDNELFGHEKGAFTGADRTFQGRFEESNEGTLFLDEIGEMSLALQVKLLRILQEKTYRRLGGKADRKWTGRLVLATHQDLERLVREKKFREDLFYRINVVNIHIPPLRERRVDIPMIAENVLKNTVKSLDLPTRGLSIDFIKKIMSYDWPGNIRQLQNVIQRCCLSSTASELQARQIETMISTTPEKSLSAIEVESEATDGKMNFEEAVRELEIRMIKKAMKACKGNKTKAAEQLGIHRKKLSLKLKQYDLFQNQGPGKRKKT